MSAPRTMRVGRRDFLRAMTLMAAGGAAAACATRGPGTGAAASVSLEEFLALSTLVTGVKDLNADHARIYLASLQASRGRELAMLCERAGFRTITPPASLDALVRTGALDSTAGAAVAAKIVEYWFTGIYDSPTGPRVATYTEALAWSTLAFTKPPSACGGGVGYWAEAPSPA
jgi:hypothetical protein